MKIFNYSFILLFSLVFFACETEDDPTSTEPNLETTDATEVTQTSAKLSGSVEGTDIVDKGFAYAIRTNINQPLDESDLSVSLGPGAGDIETTITGLRPGTTYLFSAYSINSEGVFETGFRRNLTTLEDTTTEPDPLALGDTYEGGVIYFLDNSGEHGLLAAPSDQTSGANWETSLDACFAYSLEGNSDWRMPDISELEFMYDRRIHIPGMASIAYWSRSVEGSNNNLAYGVFFGTGSNAGQTFVYNKTDGFQHSRAIRDF